MQKPTKFNYYEILEVRHDCTDSEIHQAYRRLRATYSGDNPAIYSVFSNDEAKELLKLVDEAYQVLGNFSLRNLYNEKIASRYTKPEDVSYESLQTELKHGSFFIFNAADLKPKYTVNHDFETEIRENKIFSGTFLKRVREYKGLTLEQISHVTKVNVFYVNALEEQDFANLPAPVFVRGYINQIAKTLGLDEKKTADSYMSLYKKSFEQRA